MASVIIGVDEAGRGPLAGPVVAAAVVLCEGGIPGLNDSKKLSAARRAILEAEIKAQCQWAIGEASVEEIDAINILQATMLAMARAVAGLLGNAALRHPREGGGPSPALAGQRRRELDPRLRGDDEIWGEVAELEILVDGNRLPDWGYPSRAIVGGDASEPAISAASIVAKEHRDRLMVAAATQWPQYGFARHKGYGTAEHMAALRAHGPCPVHRTSFAPCRQFALPV